jgi:enamine deaminase RidA (YjgF/YER057c/UK114 family)
MRAVACYEAPVQTWEAQVPVTRYESSAVYSKVTEANGFVFTAGVIPADLSRDVEGQTAEVLVEIDRLLALAGADKSKVVQATVWLNDIRHRDGMNKAWSAGLGGRDAPARACVEAKVIDPRMLVEISVVAVK